jgi:hypothetical protein
MAIKFNAAATPGSFYARDNVKKFIKVAVKTLEFDKDLAMLSSKDISEAETSEAACKRVVNCLLNLNLRATQRFGQEPVKPVEDAIAASEEWEDEDFGIRFFGTDADDEVNEWRYVPREESSEDESPLAKARRARRTSGSKRSSKSGRAASRAGSVAGDRRQTRRKSVLAAKKEARAKAEAEQEKKGKRDALEEFFCMTTAAVLRKLQETGELDDFKWADFSAKRLYKQAVVKSVPWHMWHDWIRNRVLARSSEATDDVVDGGDAAPAPADDEAAAE